MTISSEKPLKILMINKFYHLFGGAETCFFATKKLFENRGHQVVVFSMNHPKNLPSPQSKYFTEYLDFSGDTKYGPRDKLHVAMKLIYSFEAKKKIAALIKDEKPDVAHMHNIYHHLSPSIISQLHRAGVPTLMTLHDNNLICLNYLMVSDEKVCEACRKQQFWRALPKRCVKNSFTKTALSYIEHGIHRFMRLYEKIDLLITPSDFLRRQHIKMGLDPHRFVTIENFMDIEDYKPKYEHEGYILYFGRLSFEKGIDILIRAMLDLPDIPLKIAGSGPKEPKLSAIAEEIGVGNVEFLGFKTGNDLVNLVRNSAFTIVPSICYENCSMTVLESFAYGKPVIGSEIGGIPEQVLHGKNGYLFQPGNVDKLSKLIRELYKTPELIRQMGKEARKTVETKYSDERHYEKLMEVYQRLIDEKSRP